MGGNSFQEILCAVLFLASIKSAMQKYEMNKQMKLESLVTGEVLG